MEIENTFTLISKTGDRVSVAANVANYSGLVRMTLGDDDDDDQQEVHLHNVSTGVLTKIIEYCEYHVNGNGKKLSEKDPIESPLRSANISECVPKWYSEFITGFNTEELMEVLLAANYMDISTLIELCSATVGTMLKGKSPEDIRAKFGIVNDLTPEEEETAREEYKYLTGKETGKE
jgi:S-phase kinase-associated protein 1